jgi:hypothetical protein
MGRVIFLNTWLNIPEDERRKHDQIQSLISERLAEFNYETREYNKFQRALSKQRSHNLWRSRMKLITSEGSESGD